VFRDFKGVLRSTGLIKRSNVEDYSLQKRLDGGMNIKIVKVCALTSEDDEIENNEDSS